MKKIDLGKELAPLYRAKRKVEEVSADRGVFLSVDGQGEPGGEAFQKAIGLLYGAAYALKLAKKAEGLDFKVGKLECLWTFDDPDTIPTSEWTWRLLIRVPDAVTAEDLQAACRALRDEDVDASAVRRVTWKEGRALQVMHVGPYEAIGEAHERVRSRAEELGYRIRGPAHEVYVNDPRRTAADNLKTIVRVPISWPRPSHARGGAAPS